VAVIKPRKEIAATAQAMRELGEDEREELIVAAGDKVGDARSIFEDRQKQTALSRTYRHPKKPPTGVA
jgi:hypothetical protein